jgi:hypothetical protein
VKASTFRNTDIKVSNWPKDLHVTHSQGYAYALSTHHIFLCGANCPFVGWSIVDPTVSTGVEDWCRANFGATDFQSTLLSQRAWLAVLLAALQGGSEQ